MTEQESFERWASVDGSVMRTAEKRGNGMYKNSNTQHAWRGWKACAALKDAEITNEKSCHATWKNEHLKDMGELNKRINELAAQNEAMRLIFNMPLMKWVAEQNQLTYDAHGDSPIPQQDSSEFLSEVEEALAMPHLSAEILRRRDISLLHKVMERIQPQDIYQDDYFNAKCHSHKLVSMMIEELENEE